MLSIVYSSRASEKFDEEALASLLAQSRANNERLELSGMLLFREGRFLQILEGPDEALRERYAVIADDPRHTQVHTLIEEAIDHRFFAQWSMRYEVITDADAATAPGYRTSFEDLEREVGSSGTIPALRELIRWFQQKPEPTR